MIELLFVACLANSPEDCREHSLLYSNITPMQCLMAAQPQLAQWSNTHPAYTIDRWRCRTVNLALNETDA